MADRHPWKVWSGFRRIGSASTRQAAMNIVDRPYLKGRYEVRHARTGEAWVRAGGIWSKTAEPRTEKRPRQRQSGRPCRPASPQRAEPLQRRLL